MIQRLLLNELKSWKDSADRKPLILRGARQVGKSTLVDIFSKEYDVYIKLNLDKKEDNDIFDRYTNVHELVDYLLLKKQIVREGKAILLFIDEIQNNPNAIWMLRYFYEEANWIHVIAAGSLLESLMGSRISFPVGRVQYMALRPCSFLEFLNATGDDFYREVITTNGKTQLIHNELISKFKQYCIVGGMPAAVMQYVKTNDINATNNVYSTLLTAYSEDVEKYARNKTLVNVVQHIIRNAWNYGGQIIKFEGFAGSNYKSREVSEAFTCIQRAMLLELVYPVTDTHIPLIPILRRRPKLIMLDTGLMNFFAGVREDVFSTTDINDAWRGHVAEHIVAQEILAYTDSVMAKRYFWTSEKTSSTSEVDFVINHRGMCIPIEVKSGNNSHLKSLHVFMDNAPHDLAIRIWSKPLQVDEVKTQKGKVFKLYNIPFYLLSKIADILDGKIIEP